MEKRLCQFCESGLTHHVCPKELDPLPMVELGDLSTESCRIWLKVEWTDPLGSDPLRSIKRKPACLLFSDALEKGLLDRNKILLSATSGNLGIELGLLAASQNLPFFAVVPGSLPEYNLKVMLELGINVIKTEEQTTCPREFTVFFARGYSHEYHHRLVNLEQYYSWLNPLAHSLTTAQEILRFDGAVDHVVAAVGSCGTICGILQATMAAGRKISMVGVQPSINQGVPGTHVIKGDCRWTPENYSPVVLPGDCIVTADKVDTYAYTTKLWNMGIDAGPSTGMALSRAHRMVREGAVGNIIVISPDSNFKYSDLISLELSALKDEIIHRHPELEIDEAIEAYIDNVNRKAGLDWLLGRVRDCYSSSTTGDLYAEQDIEEIVLNYTPDELEVIHVD